MASMSQFLTPFILLACRLWFNFTYFQILSVFISIQVVKYFVTSGKSDYKLPAGPIGLPFVGNILGFVLQDTEKYLLSLTRQFGDMMTVRYGSLINVIINDYDVMKEFSLHPEFQDRPDIGVERDFFQAKGVIDAEGTSWKHQRRFMLHSLRDSGMGTMRMEEKIVDEMKNVIEEMKRNQGETISIDMLMEKSTCNVIFGLAFNKSFSYDDPNFISLLSKLDENIALTSAKMTIFSMFSWLKPFITKEYETMGSNFKVFQDISSDFIKEHRQNMDPDNPRDLLDLYLMEMDKPQDDNAKSEYHNTFTEDELKQLIIDLFIAGTETSSTTIRWSILYMIRNPDIQKQVQQELDDVVGLERMPNYSDKINLPYTMATLQEVERMAAIVPVALPRSNDKPAKFRQYKFPARTIFNIHVNAIHRDPKLWSEPERFMPTRFINDQGKVFRPPYLIPFGSGKRSCAGEALARMEIFLMFTMLMQTFNFESEPGKKPNVACNWGVIRSPKAYKIRVHERNK